MLHTGDVLFDQLLAVIVGVMLFFSPDAVRAVEVCLNRWTSTRQMGKGVDTIHLTLDRWVWSFPRAAGWTLALGAAIILIASMIVWLGRN